MFNLGGDAFDMGRSFGSSLAESILSVGDKKRDVLQLSRIEVVRQEVEHYLNTRKDLSDFEEVRKKAMDILRRQREEFFIKREIFDADVIGDEIVKWAVEKINKERKENRIPSEEDIVAAGQVELPHTPPSPGGFGSGRGVRRTREGRRGSAFSGDGRREDRDALIRQRTHDAIQAEKRKKDIEAAALARAAELRRERERAMNDINNLINSDNFLTLPVTDGIRAAVERTVHYAYIPGDRPPSNFREQGIKKELSERSQKDYKRTKTQIEEELALLGAGTVWDKVAYIASSAQMLEVSGYKRLRAGLLRMAHEDGDRALEVALKSMPRYSELCSQLERAPSRRSTPITEARRAAQDERVFLRLLGRLSPVYADTICIMRYTGCRAVEASSVRLERHDNALQVTIANAKVGTRKQKKDEVSRSFDIPLSTPEGRLLSAILDRRGSAPCAGQTPNAIRAAWGRTRKWEGKEKDPNWSLHALRHQYARDYKRQMSKMMEETHGPDWRVQLYGEQWYSSEEYKKTFYGPLADRLGHTCADMAKIYG